MISEFLLRFLRWESLIAVVFIWAVYKLVSWLQDPFRSIPGPKGSLIFGNTLDMATPNDGLQCLLKWREQYGEIFKIWNVLDGYRVHLSNPDYIKKILVQEPQKFQRPDLIAKLASGLFGDGDGVSLFVANGKQHAMQRKMLNPAFSYANVQKFIPVFNEKSEQLIKYWERKMKVSGNGSFEEEIQRKFTNLTLDIIGESSFGYDFNSINDESTEESQATDKILRGQFNLARRAWEFMLPILRYIPSKEKNELKKEVEIFRGTIYKVIEQRRKEMADPDAPKRKDLLQVMFEMVDEEGHKFTNDDLFAQVRTFMVAGHETTSMAMTWTTLVLAKYPEVQAKVQEEIKGIISKDEEITYEKLCKMKYLDNCIKESMRLYPPALFVGRTALKDVQFGPYTVPKGTNVIMDICVAQRDGEFWKDPEKFNPDRFDQGPDDQSLFSYRFLPFSRGPRMCIGYRFAEVELKVVLAKLLRCFTFKLGENQDKDFKGEMVLTYRPLPRAVVAISSID